MSSVHDFCNQLSGEGLHGQELVLSTTENLSRCRNKLASYLMIFEDKSLSLLCLHYLLLCPSNFKAVVGSTSWNLADG